MDKKKPSQGVRKLTLKDQLPDCEIFVNKQNLYALSELCKNKCVADIGCGFGKNQEIVESAGGKWFGIEPFEGGANTLTGSAEDVPLEDNSVDVVIMDAVLEHVEDPVKAFSEVSRILKKGGFFIGYVAFMECFHEISYAHLSHKFLERYSVLNGMKLLKINCARSFGIDYHLRIMFYPIWFKPFRWIIKYLVILVFKVKSKVASIFLTFKLRNRQEAKDKSKAYFYLNCLRFSSGFDFIIQKL